jgi:hypothetical protein
MTRYPPNPPRSWLVFEASLHRLREVVGWLGPWPPPEKILVLDGESGQTAHVDLTRLTSEIEVGLAELREMGTATEFMFVRRSYSRLSTEIDHEANAHVFRGAWYELEGTGRSAVAELADDIRQGTPPDGVIKTR